MNGYKKYTFVLALRKPIALLFICLLTTLATTAQVILYRADSAFHKKDYAVANELYKRAHEKLQKRSKYQHKLKDIDFMIAECYQFVNNYGEAKKWYEIALVSGYNEPDIYWKYGDALLMTGKYSQAQDYYNAYKKRAPWDQAVDIKLESCHFAQSTIENVLPLYQTANIREINSPFSEYGLELIKKKLIFASARFSSSSNKYDRYTGQNFSDFFETQFIPDKRDPEKSYWGAPVLCEGGINSEYNDGTLSFQVKGGIGYFMQCNGLNGKSNECAIYTSAYNMGSNVWGPAEPLEFQNKEYSLGHPAINSRGVALFFVSDMPGGQGGKDLWVMKRLTKSKPFDPPVNLGPIINTPGDEMFPTVVGDTILYFSSNGRVGFGALDIYYSKIIGDSLTEPVNIGQDINSSADDFGILFMERDSGLFCSNRQGGVGDDDIYSFSLREIFISLTGVITNKQTGKPIDGAIVILKAEGIKGDSLLSMTSPEGHYTFYDIKPNVTYTLTAKKFGFLGDSKDFSSAGAYDKKDDFDPQKFFSDLELKLKEMLPDSLKTDTMVMDSLLKPVLVVQDTIKITRKVVENMKDNKVALDVDMKLIEVTSEEIELPEIYYDFNKWTLRESSKLELKKFINLLNINKTAHILINAHTDSRGSDIYNQILSERRAEAVVLHLIDNGISRTRLSFKGWGETKPKVDSAFTETDHQKNRRTTFQVINPEDVRNPAIMAQYKSIEEMIQTSPAQIYDPKLQENILQTDAGVQFKVQIASSKVELSKFSYQLLEANIPEQKVTYFRDPVDREYKYSMGAFSNYPEAADLRKKIRDLGFKAFIVAYQDGQKISTYKAMITNKE